MLGIRTALVALAAVLTLAACDDDPGRVVDKITEGDAIMGNHFVLCKRESGKTDKVRTPYDKFIAARIGDPC